jgi:flagellar FliL protein
MADAPDSKSSASSPASGGGLKAWLPLLLTVLLMPALAYVMTSFVLVPKLQKSLGLQAVSAREGAEGEAGGQPGESTGKEPGGAKTKGPKVKVPLTKIIVNVSGSLGSRMLLASFTLAGNSADFKTRVEENTDQLRDIAASVLSSKTISDLEKPDARNLVRAELLSQFNAALGGGVQEIYLTEFAIQ